METANYSVIRYMPDPARGERLNVGVLLWTPNRYVIRIDDAALDRVVRENPHLERESLYYVAPAIRERLSGMGSVEERVAAILENQGGFPADLTDARYVAVCDYVEETLDDAAEALIKRVVQPRKHVRSSAFDARRVLTQRLSPLIRSGRVVAHRVFSTSGTGLSRAVDFYANSNVNTALDVLKLNITKANEIRARADAEAFKVYDIGRENDVRFVVYCDLPVDRELKKPAEEAQRVIESTGAVVVTSPDDAAASMRGSDDQ